jgi:hypothetical protein
MTHEDRRRRRRSDGIDFCRPLHADRHDTVLVDVAAPLVEMINAEGVTIVRGEDQTITRVPATSDPASVGVVDIVVFCASATTPAAAKLAGPSRTANSIC